MSPKLGILEPRWIEQAFWHFGMMQICGFIAACLLHIKSGSKSNRIIWASHAFLNTSFKVSKVVGTSTSKCKSTLEMLTSGIIAVCNCCSHGLRCYSSQIWAWLTEKDAEVWKRSNLIIKQFQATYGLFWREGENIPVSFSGCSPLWRG